MIRQSSPNDLQLHKYDHLIPPAKKVLKFTARATWFLIKTLVNAFTRYGISGALTGPLPARTETSEKIVAEKFDSYLTS